MFLKSLLVHKIKRILC